MSTRSERVKKWRELTKSTIVKAMGGKCCICGYDTCNDALEIHHRDPYEKDFGIGRIMANPKSWDKIIIELRKCVMLCSNHHREVHKGISEIPKNETGFNEEFVDFRKIREHQEFNECPICKKMKPSKNITCSRACAAKKSRTIKWDSVNLLELKNSNISNDSIGSSLGISGGAVAKRLKKIGAYVSSIKEKKYCEKCGTEIAKRTKNNLCCGCFSLSRRKVERPSKEALIEDIKNSTWTTVGKKYGVSDNAIRKWAKNYGIVV